MSFNYGEIHMFDSLRKDMEKTPKHVTMNEDTLGPLNNNKSFPFNAPLNGRRHTVANVWAPFPDDKGKCVANNTTVTDNSHQPVMPQNRRLSVVDRMKQYMSGGGSDGVYKKSDLEKHFPPKLSSYPYVQTPLAHAIAAHMLTTVAMVRGCKCPRATISAK